MAQLVDTVVAPKPVTPERIQQNLDIPALQAVDECDEEPKSLLNRVQQRIMEQILCGVPSATDARAEVTFVSIHWIHQRTVVLYMAKCGYSGSSSCG